MNKFDELMRQHNRLAADFRQLWNAFERKYLEIKKYTWLSEYAIKNSHEGVTPLLEIIPGFLAGSRTGPTEASASFINAATYERSLHSLQSILSYGVGRPEYS